MTVTIVDPPPAPAPPLGRWTPSVMLVGAADGDAADAARPHLRCLPVLRAVGRRTLPLLIEATVIPALLVYGLMALGHVVLAMVAALAWSYSALARRRLAGRPIPGLLVLSTVSLTARTTVALVLASTVLYFLQPIVNTLLLAAVFFGSLATDRPIIARLARDFCPMAPDVAARPGLVRLFRQLTVVWGLVHVSNATATFALLVTFPPATYVATKTVTCLAISTLGVVVTVVRSVATARRERVAFAPLVGTAVGSGRDVSVAN